MYCGVFEIRSYWNWNLNHLEIEFLCITDNKSELCEWEIVKIIQMQLTSLCLSNTISSSTCNSNITHNNNNNLYNINAKLITQTQPYHYRRLFVKIIIIRLNWHYFLIY